MTSFSGRRILVVGLGISGFAAARALLDLDAKVTVTESAASPALTDRADRLRALGAEVEVGGHDLDRLDFDLAVVSPGIPPASAIVEALMDARVPVWSEIELAFRLARCDFLAVTGTNGKTTTTSLLASMLEQSGIPSLAAGNIGLPLVDAIAQVPEGGAIALEVSSFQLATIESFRPKVAVLLNIAEDHTDWHGSIEAYADAKARIIGNQEPSDVFVYAADDERCREIAGRARGRRIPFSAGRVPEGGAGVSEGVLHVEGSPLIAASDVPLRGAAGLEDTLAAAAAAAAFGVDRTSIVRAIKGFRPLHHRLEVVAESARGVTYIDDSKATNPHATLAAVKGLRDVVLIAGGRSKGIDLSALAATVPPVIAVVALGEARDEVAEVFEGLTEVDMAADMATAVRLAERRSVPGGSVLLSPGCASLDMYESYAARGEEFARCVRSIIEESWREGNGGNP